MGLFDKVKSILFEEEEVEEVDTPTAKVETVEEPVRNEVEVKPLPEVTPEVKPRETHFEQVIQEEKPAAEFSERDLFRSESTFKFPAFDEEEFEESIPKSGISPELNRSSDYDRRRDSYSRLDTIKPRDDVKEEKKRFKPSPVISPVYGILDKDYKVEDIKEASKDADNNILTSKDLDVEIVRKKAFGKLDDTLKKAPYKTAVTKETYEIKKETKTVEEVKDEPKVEEEKIDDVIISNEPILDDSHNLMEERAKTIDELLKDASDEVIDVDTSKEIPEVNYDDLEDEINSELEKIEIDDTDIDDVKETKTDKDVLENDTLENDLYDLIDSMYDNTEDGE